MLATIIVQTQPMAFPLGTTGGPWRIAVNSVDGTVSQSVDSGEPTAKFSLQPGEYQVSAQRLDVNGSPLGPSVSASFTVEAPTTVQIDVANGIVVAFE